MKLIAQKFKNIINVADPFPSTNGKSWLDYLAIDFPDYLVTFKYFANEFESQLTIDNISQI